MSSATEVVSTDPAEPAHAATPGDFAAWVRPHLPAMAALAARLSSDAERDDVVQEALVRAWRRRATYDERRGGARPWLLAIVADRARRSRVHGRPAQVLIDVGAPAQDPDGMLDLDRAVRSLPPRQRMAVELYYFVGLGVADTAAAMGCSLGTVKSTLSDARSRLRSLLGDDR